MNLFNVCQFFTDGSHEYVRKNVPRAEALAAVAHYTDNVASRMGLTKRVIVTDNTDSICLEWKYGKGIVFPPKEKT